MKVAVASLGLADVAPFNIEKKVLGLPTTPADALVRRSVSDFTDEASRDTPAPWLRRAAPTPAHSAFATP